MTRSEIAVLRLSLVFVWLATTAVSLWEREGQSLQLLGTIGRDQPWLAQWLIWGGAGLDAVLGLALLLYPSRSVYLTALGLMLGMTAVATAMDPALWLHPLGPLTKNIPIAAILWTLAKTPR